SPTVTATTIDDTPSPSPSAATPTVTATPARSGPEITYFGVARADSFSLAPSDFDPDGRPIYLRPSGHSLSLIIEGRPGPSGGGLGQSAYDTAGGLPDLQLIVSRPLGNGSVEVCDDMPPLIGGVPVASPFAFSDDPALVAAINDLGCRTDNGAGSPLARSATTACTLDGSGEYAFVDDTTTAQFCVPISVPWAFPAGDTIVAARLRDVAGNLGAPREIVLRNAAVSGPTATPPPTSTRTRRPPFSPTPTPDESQPSATPADTSTITITATPTLTPLPGDTPQITHFGLARADDRPLSAGGSDDGGPTIYSPLTGQGMVIVVEARAGGRSLGRSAYRPEGVPDLEIILSRP